MSLFLRFTLGLLISTSLIGAAQAVELDTLKKQLGYSLGYEYITRLEQRRIKLDMDAFNAAVNDVLQGNNIRMSRDEMSSVMRANRQSIAIKRQAEVRLKAGQDYLEKNKNKPGVVVLPSGLQYIEHQAGKGGSPSPDSKVKVHYRGTFINGRGFDRYNNPDQPAFVELNGALPGFVEALTLMKPGAKWTVSIPSDLAYGTAGSGDSSGTKIGPNETLIYDIELISVE